MNKCPLRPDLTGDDSCSAAGRTVIVSPLILARELLAQGVNPDRAVEIYRGSTLALRLRSAAHGHLLVPGDHFAALREAAQPEINSMETDFVRGAGA